MNISDFMENYHNNS